MIKRYYWLILISLGIFSTACGTAPPALITPTPQTATQSSSSTTSMGMGMGGMMARHHAPIPADYAGLRNPLPADDASIARGAEIFATHCVTCHGESGMGDGPTAASLDPAPAPIARTSQMMGDDYQFWRISEGGAMEPFNSSMIAWKGILNEQQRWDVINYIQALGRGAVMPGGQMGGAAFDPTVEAADQAEMLAQAVEQGIITEDEAAVFSSVHEIVDAQILQARADGAQGSMDDLLNGVVAELVSSAELTEDQAATFLLVHTRLGEAELMR